MLPRGPFVHDQCVANKELACYCAIDLVIAVGALLDTSHALDCDALAGHCGARSAGPVLFRCIDLGNGPRGVFNPCWLDRGYLACLQPGSLNELCSQLKVVTLLKEPRTGKYF